MPAAKSGIRRLGNTPIYQWSGGSGRDFRTSPLSLKHGCCMAVRVNPLFRHRGARPEQCDPTAVEHSAWIAHSLRQRCTAASANRARWTFARRVYIYKHVARSALLHQPSIDHHVRHCGDGHSCAALWLLVLEKMSQNSRVYISNSSSSGGTQFALRLS